MVYSYYDYLEKYYEDYYDYYYEYTYWPYYYGNYNGSNTTYNGTYPPSPYEYVSRYNMDYITPPLFTISILCAIISIFLTILICYKVYKSKHSKKKKSDTDGITIGLTIFCALMHLIQNVIDPFTYYTWFIQYDPIINDQLYIAYNAFWCLSKISIYILFIYRYYLLFKASKMMTGSSDKQTFIIFGSFCIAMITQCCLYLVYMLLNHELIKYEDTDYGQRVWLSVCWAFLIIDMLLIGILGYLLTHSILKLLININKARDNNDDKNKFNMPSKTENSQNSTKIESQLSGYMKDNDHIQTTETEMATNNNNNDENKIDDNVVVDVIADDEELGLFLKDYGLNKAEFVDKLNKGRIQLHHLININENDLNELCTSLGLIITQKIKFKKAIKELQTTHDFEATSVGSMGSTNSIGSVSATTSSVKYKGRKKNKNKDKSSKLNNLMHTTTRIGLTMGLSMLSSFIYQFLWLLACELEDWDIMWMTYTWCIDAVINILCIYLSMAMAKNHYKKICHDCCKLHQLTLKCIQKIVPQAQ